jgi:hypothetical protein
MNSAFARFLVEVWCMTCGIAWVRWNRPLHISGSRWMKTALPRHQHVVEHREPVALVEPRRQRVVHARGGVLVHHRGPARRKRSPGVATGIAEAEGIGRRLGVGGEKGRRHTRISSE